MEHWDEMMVPGKSVLNILIIHGTLGWNDETTQEQESKFNKFEPRLKSAKS